MSYKLAYFDARGIAEPIRLIFAYAGVEFEDVRAPFDSNVMPPTLPLEIKEKCTWGQVPLLEFDGKKLCQSLAITRYVAKKYNLVPKDDYEAALCDEYVDSIREYFTSFMPVVMEKDEAARKEKLEVVLKTAADKFLSKFEKILKDNGGQRLVGKDLTWADIYVAHVFWNIEKVVEINNLKDFPTVRAFTDSVLSIPKLKTWINKRPDTKF